MSGVLGGYNYTYSNDTLVGTSYSMIRGSEVAEFENRDGLDAVVAWDGILSITLI